MSDVRLAVAGLGYWAPNLARNFAELPGCELTWICDANPAACERVAARFPGVRTTTAVEELLDDPALDAVVLATPVPSHGPLGVRVMEAVKHCYVEKPLAIAVVSAERAVTVSRETLPGLMCGLGL